MTEPPSPSGPSNESMLRMFVADRSVPCPSCGYDLRGLTGTFCPECRQHLVLRVGLAEPRLAAFVAGLVGWSAGLGFCGIVLVWGLVEWYRWRGRGPELWELVPLFAGAAICLAGTLFWNRLRAVLGRQPAAARWSAVAVSWLIALSCPAWFVLTVG